MPVTNDPVRRALQAACKTAKLSVIHYENKVAEARQAVAAAQLEAGSARAEYNAIRDHVLAHFKVQAADDAGDSWLLPEDEGLVKP